MQEKVVEMTSSQGTQPNHNPMPPIQPVYPPHDGDRSGRREPRDMTICGILGLVFGVLAFVLSFIPLINYFAVVFGALGVILAVIGIVGTFRGAKRGKAVAILAAAFSVLALVITFGMYAAANTAVTANLKNSASTSPAPSQTSKQSAKSPNTRSSAPSGAAASGAKDGEGDLAKAHVKIFSAVRSNPDYNGAATVLVTYQWKNKSDANASFAVATNSQAFQNGQQLQLAIYMNNPAGYDSSSYLANLQPGAVGTVTIGYVLKDDSPVTVEVTDFIALGGSAKVAHTFAM